MSKKAVPVNHDADVETIEKAAYERYKEMQDLAFSQGGMGAVLQVGGEAIKVAEAAVKVGGAPPDLPATKMFVAGYLLANWMPGIIKHFKASPRSLI